MPHPYKRTARFLTLSVLAIGEAELLHPFSLAIHRRRRSSLRLGSALFAAVTLESVLHLAIMSGIVAVTRRVSWGVAGATVAYVLFHLSTLGGQPAATVLAATFGNAFAGIVFGLLFARYGYESLVLAHLVAHGIAVGLS